MVACISLEDIMSTRESIWFGENDRKSVHIYFELAERSIADGRMTGAPLYIAVEGIDANKQLVEVAMRLPKEIGQALVAVLSPGRQKEVL
jgi:hypothetical protein